MLIRSLLHVECLVQVFDLAHAQTAIVIKGDRDKTLLRPDRQNQLPALRNRTTGILFRVSDLRKLTVDWGIGDQGAALHCTQLTGIQSDE